MSGRTSYVILCDASIQRDGQLATTQTLPYTYTDIAKINLHTALLTVFVPISCQMRSQHRRVFLNVVTSTYARHTCSHSLNMRNFINLKHNFKKIVIKNTKEKE